VQKTPLELFRLPNFGEKSLREVTQKLAALGVTLGMTLDDDSDTAAVVPTVAARLRTRRGEGGMVTGTDRRRVARLTVPRRWGGGDQEPQLVRVHELSALGARITHREPLHAGGIGYVDLPPALGTVRLRGRLVWTRLRRMEQTLDGDRRALYESGLEFTSLTPEQRAALAGALSTLYAAQAASARESST
jgi:hypothetical protein